MGSGWRTRWPGPRGSCSSPSSCSTASAASAATSCSMRCTARRGGPTTNPASACSCRSSVASLGPSYWPGDRRSTSCFRRTRSSTSKLRSTGCTGRGFKRDLRDAEVHLLETGHFALEDDLDLIADTMRRFCARTSTAPGRRREDLANLERVEALACREQPLIQLFATGVHPLLDAAPAPPLGD